MTLRREEWRNRKKVYTPKSRRRWKYRLSVEAFDALFANAAGVCQICDTEVGAENLTIDHCHETGVVRGLLCRRCNVALGWLDDRPERLLTAYLYLKAHGKFDETA